MESAEQGAAGAGVPDQQDNDVKGDEAPPDEEGVSGGSATGSAKANATRQYHLRPVEGKGLKPIPLHESEPRVVGRSAHFGILDEKNVDEKQLECKLTYSPVTAVELRAINAVYVKDRFGVLKMLKPGYIGYLKMGEVLYLCFLPSEGGPKYGYVLTEGLPATRNDSGGRRGGDGAAAANDRAAGASEGAGGA
eukprot:CAMPEP_0197575642 /NCGR_PEP_ID=MMETSP1326-20131121/977_1 /TAXON_ID=1155430 /ORGANISM="Genus nov. species nov., Strain RCC2288" /LENGTH=192 /DNA_ID=CAMNT_0043138451 /DNA_START=124 /DNA_END=698 /DNA_ORIENTATION=-